MDQPFESDVMEDMAVASSFESIEEMFDDFDNLDSADYDTEGYDAEGYSSENFSTENFGSDDGFSSTRSEAFTEESSDLWAEDSAADTADTLETNTYTDAFSSEFESDYGEVADSYAESDYSDSNYGEDSYASSGFDGIDSIDSAIADALAAGDTDGFIRRLRQVANVARQVGQRVGRSVGQVARTVAPIASAIPLPQAQAIGRIAQVAGRLLFDGGDELDALDAVIDLAESEGEMDAAIPVIAGLTIRSLVPRIAQAPRPLRQQLVRSVSQSTRLLTRRQGPQAARAIAPVVRSVQRTAQQRRLPIRQLPQAVQQTARRVAANPRLTRQLAQRSIRPIRTPQRPARAVIDSRRGVPAVTPRRVATRGVTTRGVAIDTGWGVNWETHPGDATGGATGVKRLILQGPVEILIRSR
jgi:hypothetical protein